MIDFANQAHHPPKHYIYDDRFYIEAHLDSNGWLDFLYVLDEKGILYQDDDLFVIMMEDAFGHFEEIEQSEFEKEKNGRIEAHKKNLKSGIRLIK